MRGYCLLGCRITFPYMTFGGLLGNEGRLPGEVSYHFLMTCRGWEMIRGNDGGLHA